MPSQVRPRIEAAPVVEGLGRGDAVELDGEQAAVPGLGELGGGPPLVRVVQAFAGRDGGVLDVDHGGGRVEGLLVEEGGDGLGVAVEDPGALEEVLGVVEERLGVAVEELVAVRGGEEGREGGVVAGERVEGDGAAHDVGAAAE